jgi:hypothetical protein
MGRGVWATARYKGGTLSDRQHARGPVELGRRRFLGGAVAAAGAMAAGLAGAGPVRAHDLAPSEPSPFPVEPGRFAAQALTYLYGPVQRVGAVAPEALITAADTPHLVRMAGGYAVAIGGGFANAAKRLLSVALNLTELAVGGAHRELGSIRIRLDPTRPAPPSALQSLDPSRFFQAFGDQANRNPLDPRGTYEKLFATFFPASVTTVFNAVVRLGSMPDTELVNRDPIALGSPSVPWFPPAGEGYTILNAPVELVPRSDPGGRTVAVVDSFPAVVDFLTDAAPLARGKRPAPPA